MSERRLLPWEKKKKKGGKLIKQKDINMREK